MQNNVSLFLAIGFIKRQKTSVAIQEEKEKVKEFIEIKTKQN